MSTFSRRFSSGLIGYWALQGDFTDHSGHSRHLVNHGATATPLGALFDGRGSYLEAPAAAGLQVGDRPFTITAWIHTEVDTPEIVGDIASRFDAETRTGFSLSVVDQAGVTASQANYRNVQFGIDAGTEPRWTDCGRPGEAVWISALAVNDGRLYAGTYEHGERQTGHVYRYEGGDRWHDCKVPAAANCVSSLLSLHGRLYAATGRYDSRGSSIGSTGNPNPESRIWCMESDGTWSDLGAPPGEPDLYILGLYRGRLYTVPNYRVGLYGHDGGSRWTTRAEPIPRFFAMAQWRGHLYGAANRSLRSLGPPPNYERIFTPLPNADGVYRYIDEANHWTGCGPVGEETQMYGFAVHRGSLYVGTWPSAKVYRSVSGIGWEDCGRIHPDEKEIMAMAVYNGMLYVGTLPAADVYRFDGRHRWTHVGSTDRTADATYRRAWSMAVHDGRLFVGTLPSGRVYAMEAGCAVSDSRELAWGWQHVTAVRETNRLRLFVNGRPCAERACSERMDLSTAEPLRIGVGPHDYFHGRMADVRLYNQALTEEEIRRLFEDESASRQSH